MNTTHAVTSLEKNAAHSDRVRIANLELVILRP